MNETIMNEEQRRADDAWNRKEELVMSELRNLRLSSDAALKGVNDLKEEIASFKHGQLYRIDNLEKLVAAGAGRLDELQKQALQTEELKKEVTELRAQLDYAKKWILGIVATIIGGTTVGAILYLINHAVIK